MATFQEMYDEVVILTKRPDLIDKTKQAVKSATLFTHNSGFYPRDVSESGLKFNDPGFIQNFDPKNIWPLFRKIKYIRRWNYDAADPNYGKVGPFFKPIEIGQSVDAYGYDKQDVFYLAGQLQQIRSSLEFQYALAGAYLYPNVTESNYASWIADEFPFAIIYDAARRVSSGIGFREDAQDFQAQTQEVMSEILLMSDDMPGE